MTVRHENITEQSIKRCLASDENYQIKDKRYSLYFKKHANGVSGCYSLRIYKKGEQKYKKIGNYPVNKPKDVILAVPRILLGNDSGMSKCVDANSIVDWYQTRVSSTYALSNSRKAQTLSIIKNHLQDLPRLDGIELLDFVFQRVRSHCALSTAHAVVSVLKTAYSRALKMRVIDIDPLAGIKISDVSVEKKKPKGCHLTTDDFLEAGRSGAFSSNFLVMWCLLHGTRINETRTARWQDISFENATWTIPASHTKTKQEVVIPLTKMALKLLKRHRRLSKGFYLFTGRYGRVISRSSATGLFRSLSKGKWSSHDVRKRFKSIIHELRTDYYIASSLLNHKGGILDKTYIHADVMKLKLDALEKYNSFLIEKGFRFS